jgi:hypothetical protein
VLVLVLWVLWVLWVLVLLVLLVLVLYLLTRLHLHRWASLMHLVLVHLLVRMHLSLNLLMLHVAMLVIGDVAICIGLHPLFHPRLLMHMPIRNLRSVHLVTIHVVTIF